MKINLITNAMLVDFGQKHFGQWFDVLCCFSFVNSLKVSFIVATYDCLFSQITPLA